MPDFIPMNLKSWNVLPNQLVNSKYDVLIHAHKIVKSGPAKRCDSLYLGAPPAQPSCTPSSPAPALPGLPCPRASTWSPQPTTPCASWREGLWYFSLCLQSIPESVNAEGIRELQCFLSWKASARILKAIPTPVPCVFHKECSSTSTSCLHCSSNACSGLVFFFFFKYLHICLKVRTTEREAGGNR